MATALVAAERVRAALDTLPTEQREAIHLAYFGGKTYRQVAEVLGSPKAPRSRGCGWVCDVSPKRSKRKEQSGEPRPHFTDLEVEELLGAYALDACDPDEIAAIDEVLARRPDLARAAAQLSEAASWLGAAEALEPPPSSAPRSWRRRGRVGALDLAVDLYSSQSERLADAIAALPDDALDVETPNGLSARDLVIHMASQESLLAQMLGVPTVPDLDEEDIVARTEALIRASTVKRSKPPSRSGASRWRPTGRGRSSTVRVRPIGAVCSSRATTR